MCRVWRVRSQVVTCKCAPSLVSVARQLLPFEIRTISAPSFVDVLYYLLLILEAENNTVDVDFAFHF